MNNRNRFRTLAIRLLIGAILPAIGSSALAGVHYVDLNCTNATPPYTNWATAATNIQDAVDAAVGGDEVVVANGIYGPISVNKALRIRSVSGALIDGGGSVRCVNLNNSASLSGFTLTHGFGFVVLRSGNAIGVGGGAYGGTLNNCTLTDNSAGPIGYAPWFSGNGGGAYGCTLNNCTLTGNSAGAQNTYSRDDAYAYGGGASECTLNNCTFSRNSATATNRFGAYNDGGGGAWNCTLNNCIGYSNISYFGSSYTDNYAHNLPTTVSHCWFSDPLFVDYAAGNLRLQSNSPCINTGNNSYATTATDLDGNSRIAGGTVDIGAFEFQTPVSMISYAWLQQYGLPVNASTDTADPDGDAVDNYHEWLAGTNPTNALSSPAQLTIAPSGVLPSGIILTWSTNAVGFTLQSTTNLFSPAAWVTNSPAPVEIGGQNVIINPIAGPQQFYRLKH